MGGKKNIKNESASFNVPEREERQKSNYEEFITKLLGKVILKKERIFGLDVQKIVIVITPSFKIAAVVSNTKKLVDLFPQKRQDILNPEEVISWAKENGFDITFVAPTPKLKSRLNATFGDVMVPDVVSENKVRKINVKEEIEKSGLPNFVKEWGKNNPEKFIENIERIKKLLK